MRTSALKQGLLSLPGVSVALLPKLMCPACWPAYAAALSALGRGFLMQERYLLPINVAALALATSRRAPTAATIAGAYPRRIRAR